MSLTTGTAEGHGSLGSAFHKTSACKSLALMRQLPWAGQNEPLGFIKGTERRGGAEERGKSSRLQAVPWAPGETPASRSHLRPTRETSGTSGDPAGKSQANRMPHGQGHQALGE